LSPTIAGAPILDDRQIAAVATVRANCRKLKRGQRYALVGGVAVLFLCGLLLLRGDLEMTDSAGFAIAFLVVAWFAAVFAPDVYAVYKYRCPACDERLWSPTHEGDGLRAFDVHHCPGCGARLVAKRGEPKRVVT
jgi:DNA-directed RNA polymerase subunit RPC12/RpoP